MRVIIHMHTFSILVARQQTVLYTESRIGLTGKSSIDNIIFLNMLKHIYVGLAFVGRKPSV